MFTKEKLLKTTKDVLAENDNTYILGIFDSVESREKFAEALTDEVAAKLNLPA